MDFVETQLSNIDNHHYLTIVFGNKKSENAFEANIGKDAFLSKLEKFIINFNIKKEIVSNNFYRDYINDGITYQYKENNVECFKYETIIDQFDKIGNKDIYMFLNKKTGYPINKFPIDKNMDDIKTKSEIIINIDNLFDVIFLTYNDKVFYYKIVIPKYNIYKDKLILKLNEIIKFLTI